MQGDLCGLSFVLFIACVIEVMTRCKKCRHNFFFVLQQGIAKHLRDL